MVDLPTELRRRFPWDCDQAVDAWWMALTDSDRQRVLEMWDERYEVRFFAPQANEAGRADRWDQVPGAIGGRFVPREDDGQADWLPGYLEYMLQHPELYMVEEERRAGGTFTCSQHPAARACLQAGEVSADFQCPVTDPLCPMVKLRGAWLTKVKQSTSA
jgi:hypothetical protein